MKVEHILHAKGADVYSVSKSTLVKDAIEVLSDKNIGAVLVKDDRGALAGIFSERDVVRRLRREGPSVLQKPVAECMTSNVLSCDPEMNLDDVLSMMTEKRIRHLPVMRGGALVGLISIGDVVKRKIDLAEQEALALKEYIAS
jgi:CBS domain-containing protein